MKKDKKMPTYKQMSDKEKQWADKIVFNVYFDCAKKNYEKHKDETSYFDELMRFLPNYVTRFPLEVLDIWNSISAEYWNKTPSNGKLSFLHNLVCAVANVDIIKAIELLPIIKITNLKLKQQLNYDQSTGIIYVQNLIRDTRLNAINYMMSLTNNKTLLEKLKIAKKQNETFKLTTQEINELINANNLIEDIYERRKLCDEIQRYRRFEGKREESEHPIYTKRVEECVENKDEQGIEYILSKIQKEYEEDNDTAEYVTDLLEVAFAIVEQYPYKALELYHSIDKTYEILNWSPVEILDLSEMIVENISKTNIKKAIELTEVIVEDFLKIEVLKKISRKTDDKVILEKISNMILMLEKDNEK